MEDRALPGKIRGSRRRHRDRRHEKYLRLVRSEQRAEMMAGGISESPFLGPPLRRVHHGRSPADHSTHRDAEVPRFHAAVRAAAAAVAGSDRVSDPAPPSPGPFLVVGLVEGCLAGRARTRNQGVGRSLLDLAEQDLAEEDAVPGWGRGSWCALEPGARWYRFRCWDDQETVLGHRVLPPIRQPGELAAGQGNCELERPNWPQLPVSSRRGLRRPLGLRSSAFDSKPDHRGPLDQGWEWIVTTRFVRRQRLTVLVEQGFGFGEHGTPDCQNQADSTRGLFARRLIVLPGRHCRQGPEC